jgi:GNAT superfamily N-acetyltransferase
MYIGEDRWLSEIFGHDVFKIEVEPQPPSAADKSPRTYHDVLRHASERPASTYYTKVNTDEIETVRRLGATGLYVVDVNVTFALSPDSAAARNVAKDATRYEVQEISPEQHEEVLEIAGSCFRYSRFHLDPLVSPSIANRIKRDWIQNYIRKLRGERLWVASVDGRPAGFLAVIGSEAGGTRARTIDLIGVSSAFQRRGVGRALGAFFIGHYRDQCDLLQVGTQAANIPSMRLYEDLGFSIAKTTYVMHMHTKDGKVL